MPLLRRRLRPARVRQRQQGHPDRKKHWQDTDEHGRPVRRTLGIASLGGATIDNEENYLIKKLFTATGAIQIENQARI